MGWTNATQSSDIEPSEPAAKYRSRVRIETPPEAREGRPYSPSLGHPLPRCRVVNLHTTRSTLTIGYPPRVQRRQTRRGTTPGDTTHFGRNELKEKDCGRATAPVKHLGAVTRIGSCSLEKRQGRFKRKQCVRSDRP